MTLQRENGSKGVIAPVRDLSVSHGDLLRVFENVPQVSG